MTTTSTKSTAVHSGPSPATRYPLSVLILAALACLYAGVLIEQATRPPSPVPRHPAKPKPGHPPPRVTDRRMVT